MKTNLLTTASMAHAIAMILFAMQYQSHRANKAVEEALQVHVTHLAEQVEIAQVRFAKLKDPEHIREYATHALGMQQMHVSQRKSLSAEQAKALKTNI